MATDLYPQNAPGEPYRCPECGETDWRAYYPETTVQDVVLVVGADGAPGVREWCGTGYEICDDGNGPVDEVCCNSCDYSIALPHDQERRVWFEEARAALRAFIAAHKPTSLLDCHCATCTQGRAALARMGEGA